MEVVLHIPHSSSQIPASERGSFQLSGAQLKHELLKITDWYTDELFEAVTKDCRRVIYPVSRLVVDPERFVDDQKEPMSQKGMGVIYTFSSDGSLLREEPSQQARKLLIDTYYRPHHAALERAVDDALEATDCCLVIDCHSFPALPLPYELDQSPDRPDICIGTDVFHTPVALRQAVMEVFSGLGWTVAIDRPFAGALVPMKHYSKDARVRAVMIEVNRRLYMNEQTGAKSRDFEDVRARLRRGLESIIAASI